MRVKLLTLMAGPEGTFPPGSIMDLTTEKAEVLIAGRYAVFLESEQKPRKKTKPKKGR